jgi:hypothetical protein
VFLERTRPTLKELAKGKNRPDFASPNHDAEAPHSGVFSEVPNISKRCLKYLEKFNLVLTEKQELLDLAGRLTKTIG